MDQSSSLHTLGPDSGAYFPPYAARPGQRHNTYTVEQRGLDTVENLPASHGIHKVAGPA
jgi:hypothetical protein